MPYISMELSVMTERSPPSLLLFMGHGCPVYSYCLCQQWKEQVVDLDVYSTMNKNPETPSMGLIILESWVCAPCWVPDVT